MKSKHRSFICFYPSEYFSELFLDYDNIGLLKEAELNCTDCTHIKEIEKLYEIALKNKQYDYNNISTGVKVAKEILQRALDDINNFTDKSVSYYDHLMTFFGIVFSVVSIGIGSELIVNDTLPAKVILLFSVFLLIMLWAAVRMFLSSSKNKDTNMILAQYFRNAFICFEIFDSVAKRSMKNV